MPPRKRTVTRDLTILILGAALLLLPGQGLRPAFSQGFCAVMNALVGHFEFGEGGRVWFQPKPQAPQPAAATITDAWDAEVLLTSDVTHASTAFLLNARGVGFIPLVLMAALILLTPLERRRVAVAGAVGTAAVVGIVVVWTSLLLIANFSNAAFLNVYQLPPALKSAVDVAVRTLVNPPAARFLAPIGLGLSIVAWQLSRQKKRTLTGRPRHADNWQEIFD